MKANRSTIAVVLACALTGSAAAQQSHGRVFASADAAARALAHAARSSDVDELKAIFGPAGEELLASSDAVTARRNRDTFVVAFAEEWRLEDLAPGRKELVIGHESWPFPVPIVKTAAGWMFDVAAGKEEILDRRIGRNELAVIQICRAYVKAQRQYASRAHDGHPAGLYAQRFRSDAGTENGLYWPSAKGQPRSPLGDLFAAAEVDVRTSDTSRRTPFRGYYFRILSAQGPAASGGSLNYVDEVGMKRGFALIAWPAEYDVTGVMTFLVNQDGVVFEKDLGPGTTHAAEAITRYDPDLTWRTASHPAKPTGSPSPQ